MDKQDIQTLGLFGLLILVLIALLIPFIVTCLVGIAFANLLGFTGITWWAFVIFFYLASCALFASLNR